MVLVSAAKEATAAQMSLILFSIKLWQRTYVRDRDDGVLVTRFLHLEPYDNAPLPQTNYY